MARYRRHVRHQAGHRHADPGRGERLRRRHDHQRRRRVGRDRQRQPRVHQCQRLERRQRDQRQRQRQRQRHPDQDRHHHVDRANTYTGATVFNNTNGAISVNGTSSGPVLTGAGRADVQNDSPPFDNTGGTSPVSTVRSLLVTDYDIRLTSGPLRSSTTSDRGIVYADDRANTVTAVRYGDAHFDGSVSIANFNQSVPVRLSSDRTTRCETRCRVVRSRTTIFGIRSVTGMPVPTTMAILNLARRLTTRRVRQFGLGLNLINFSSDYCSTHCMIPVV